MGVTGVAVNVNRTVYDLVEIIDRGKKVLLIDLECEYSGDLSRCCDNLRVLNPVPDELLDILKDCNGTEEEVVIINRIDSFCDSVCDLQKRLNLAWGISYQKKSVYITVGYTYKSGDREVRHKNQIERMCSIKTLE